MMSHMIKYLLNMDVKSLINAANMTASINPFNGDGIKPRTILGYAVLVQLTSLLQNFMHFSGSTHATSSGYKTLLIIPGNIIRKSGRIFKYPANKVPPCACDNDLDANKR